MRTRRTSLEIVADILEVIQGGTGSKSSIMRNANLSEALTERYVKLLLSKNLIYYKDGAYKLTDKGVKILENLRELRRLELRLDELLNSTLSELS
ncbi:putative transcriptional regulator [Metallosphaera yellowstonensis MK1]|jgi:predicted transcriptional regulator|uniref:Putative transcriptional regulator n=1 Tax=Metallosphaera yellowstonensis MK1 TaxID=671065 RepID=H2C7Y5_9CREN|nr:winged helix-turn-helix domain-containing protein [Metallosphaera yellowstonensis]EHP68261.1 putative transcriptional regulator [Metallosphaera yellowstonensis MK1]